MRQMLAATLFAVSLTAVGANTFRVTPYVQHPKPDAMTVMWLAQEARDASITYWKVGSSETTTLSAVRRDEISSDESGIRFKADNALEYCLAPELGYGMDPENKSGDAQRGGGWDLPATVPYQYRVRLTGLDADTAYGYRVQLAGGASYENVFRTSPSPDQAKWHGFKFIYYSDSETEPGDNPPGGLTSDWSEPGGTLENPKTQRKYFVSQTEAYASNLCAAVDFGTDLIVMAGDLAQRGSRQCDWDEFWRHNAGPLNDPAGSIPILASPGNHDYWSYRDNSVIGPKKYLSYFEYEQNDAADMDDDQRERFHRVDYGPVTFIFLDANNGDDSDHKKDSNLQISRAGGCRAPDFNPGSSQYQWLEAQLKDAQQKSAFIFIVTHQCPFSVGYHGRPNGTNTFNDPEYYSGQTLRVLLPLLHKYGVDGWFAGHDEMMERSVHTGTETLPDGTEVSHSFNIWDMGIAGDGLRGTKLWDNPNQAYRADVDSPEIYENGILVEGGKHYGHLQVTIDQTEDGSWRATFDPIYLFFSKDSSGNLVYGGVRHYADKVVRISNRRKGKPPAPTPVTETRVDYSAYTPAKMPQGLVTTFWNGPLSRGFSWQTDTSVTETKLWLLKGEYDQDDGNTFATEGTCFTGDYEDNASVSLRCHRLHVTGLENDCTYSYRLGGNGHYVYGRFRTQSAPDSVTAVYFSDTQTKDAKLLYKLENTLAAAARTVGGADKVNLLVSGGDIFNQSTMANVNHVTGRAYAGSWEWAWGLTADLITPYFPDLPWFTVPGNHDKAYYGKLTSVDYYSTGMTYAGCSSVDVGNVHFALLPFLDSYSSTSVGYAKAFAWLDADLKASSALWKVVCVHWGPYSTGDHGGVKAGYSEGVVDYVKALAPLLSSNHVDLVLQAHDHVFTKTVPYRWDTAGYTSATDDETVLNLTPETAMIGGDAYDVNPRGTYYVCTGCAGHRAAEEPTCPTIGGEHSFTKRDPCIVVGKIGVQSRFRNIGDYASADFHEIDAKGFQMFGVLKIKDDTLAYDFYVAEENGTATLVDKLRVCKSATPPVDGQPEGKGTAASPYLINGARTLKFVKDKVDAGDEGYQKAYYRQTADIDLTGVEDWGRGIGQNWKSGAAAYDTTGGGYSKAGLSFEGVYDGNGKTVKVKGVAGSQYAGSLFDSLYGSAQVKNLTVNLTTPDSGVRGASAFGVIDGSNVMISNVTVTGEISNSSHNAGVFAVKTGGMVLFADCENQCAITNSKNGDKAGGFVGLVNGGTATFVRCVNNAQVTGAGASTFGVGGFVGNLNQGTAKFQDCANNVAVAAGQMTWCGAFIGSIDEGGTVSSRVDPKNYNMHSCSAIDLGGNTAVAGNRLVGSAVEDWTHTEPESYVHGFFVPTAGGATVPAPTAGAYRLMNDRNMTDLVVTGTLTLTDAAGFVGTVMTSVEGAEVTAIDEGSTKTYRVDVPAMIASADCVGHVTKTAVEGGYVFTAADGYTIASVYANGAPVGGLALGASVTVTGRTLMNLGTVSLVVSADRVCSVPAHAWYEAPRAVATSVIDEIKKGAADNRGAFHSSIDGEYFGFALGNGGTKGVRLYTADDLGSPITVMKECNGMRSVAISKKRNLVIVGNYKTDGDIYMAPLNATTWTENENFVPLSVVNEAGSKAEVVLDAASFSDSGQHLFASDGDSSDSKLCKYEVGNGVLKRIGAYATGYRVRNMSYVRFNGREILFALKNGGQEISAYDVTDFGHVAALGTVINNTAAVSGSHYGDMCVSGRLAGKIHLTVATSKDGNVASDLVTVYSLDIPETGAVTATQVKSFTASDLAAAGFPAAGTHAKAIMVADDERTMYFAYGVGTSAGDSAALVSCEYCSPIDPTKPDEEFNGEDAEARAADRVQAINADKASNIIVPTAVRSRADSYRAYVAARTVDLGAGKFAVRLDIAPERVGEVQENADAAESAVAAELADVATGDAEATVSAIPGLFYSVVEGGGLKDMTEGERVPATDDAVKLPLTHYEGAGFYRIHVDVAPKTTP